MRRLPVLITLLLGAAIARAGDDRAGAFDYYVLSLSWSPNWCALEGRARDAGQCAPGRGLGWSLHGLWPQHERGWPSDCATAAAPPGRAQTAAMADIMGAAGLARHEWRRHGTCSGLTAAEYFALSRRAYGRIARPGVFRRLDEPVRLPASAVEEAFLRANPTLGPDMVTITCREGHIQEARVCLTKTLAPRRCGADVVRDCTLERARLVPPP